MEAHSFENGVCKYCGEGEPEPCAHENTHKEENADKRKYTYLPLNDKPEYHSVSVTKTYNTVCDKCLSIVGDAFTESEQLADEKHTYVDSICTKCGYNNICKHVGERKTETVTTDDYQKLSDGSGHIHKITVTENVYCVDCGALLDSKLLSEESTTEPHTEDAACDLCGYMPACKHNTVTYTVKQNRVVKDNGNDATHDVETWEVTIRECADCRTELSRNSECINTEKVKHSFNLFYRSEGYKANLEICSQCGYSRPATKEAVWADANSFIQDSTIDLITRWVMNQNGVLTASESLSKLPSVVGNPYNAIKELFKKKVSDDYYSDVMKSILLDMMREKPSSESDTLIDEKLNKVRNLLTVESELVDTDEWEAIVNAEGKNSPLAYLGKFIKGCNELASIAKDVEEVRKACTPYVELLDNVVVNMDFLKGISDSVSKDSELYKASIDLQNELQNELSVFTKCFETATDKIVELGIEKGLEKGMDWLEENMEIELPLLSALSSADKILRTFPNYYVDLNNIVDAKGNMMNLYILRVDVATELMNASWSDSNVSDSVFDVYSQIVDKEFDAVDTYLKEEQKQQEGFLGWVKEVSGKKNNMTAGEWRKQLEEERKIFHEDYFNALEEAV